MPIPKNPTQVPFPQKKKTIELTNMDTRHRNATQDFQQDSTPKIPHKTI